LLPPEESQHFLKVMRARPGDELRVFFNGRENRAVCVGAEGKHARVKIGEAIQPPPPPSIQIHCLLPWIKGGRTELVVQKLTELGVAAITIFHAHREVVRGNDSKLDRLGRVALEACKQSERADVPSLSESRGLAEAVVASEIEPARCFLLYEREQDNLFSQVVARSVPRDFTGRVLIASGPEGGFGPDEIASVASLCERVSLGPRILRAETSPIAATAALLALSGNL